MPDIDQNNDVNPRALGRVEGRLASLEERMDRVEVGFNTRLTAIEAKIDSLLSALAGDHAGRRVVIEIVRWAVGPSLLGLVLYFLPLLHPH